MDIYRISKEAITVRYEADQDLNIKVFQTFSNGEEIQVQSVPGSFNEANLQSNLERHHLKSKIFKNYTKAIANLFGIGLGIATAAVAGPGIASAADSGMIASGETITNSRPIEHE